MILRFLGLIDIIAALMIIFRIYNIHWAITALFVIILFVKGVASIKSDILGITMGTMDIVAAFFILFAVVEFFPVKVVIFIVLVGKGMMSLIS